MYLGTYKITCCLGVQQTCQTKSINQEKHIKLFTIWSTHKNISKKTFYTEKETILKSVEFRMKESNLYFKKIQHTIIKL